MVWLERARLAISFGVLGLAGACGSGDSHGTTSPAGGAGALGGTGAQGGTTSAGRGGAAGGDAAAAQGGASGGAARGGASRGGSTSESGAAGDDEPGQGGTTTGTGGYAASGGAAGTSAGPLGGDGGQSGASGEAGVYGEAGIAGEGGTGGAPDTASCTDTEKNGNESDTDCGGSCPLCDDGKSCRHGGDCVSGHCVGHVCVQPPSFGSPVTLETGELGQIRLAMGDFGNAALLWEDGANDRVRSRVSSGKTFGSAFPMDANNHRAISPVAIAAFGSSGFLAVWMEYNIGNGSFARRYSGGSWSSIQTLDGDSSTFAQPQLAMNASGEGVLGTALRNTANASDNDAVVRLVTDGVINGPEILATEQEEYPYIETDVADSGDAAIGWRKTTTDGYEIWVQRSSPAGEWSEPELLGTPAEGFIRELASFDDGRVLVFVEEDESTNEPKLREYLYEPGNGWGEPRLLTFNTDQWLNNAKLARARSGALMWVYYSSPDFGLHYRLRDPGGAWSDEETIETRAATNDLALVSYDFESFRVLYDLPTAGGYESDLWSARYVPGQGFRDAGPVATELVQYRFYSLALDATGRGVVAYSVRTASPVSSPYDLRVRWLE